MRAGKAQNMLNETQADVDVGDTIAESMVAHLDDPSRLTVSGPKLSVSTQQAIGLSLAVYELATNALKYGALSNDAGTVNISWKTFGSQGFEFVWQERGGPEVTKPTRTGFGSRLTNQIVASYFSGKGETSYLQHGLRFVLTGRFDTEGDYLNLRP